MITLYYVPGISRADTLVFSDINMQKAYFSSLYEVVDIDLGFYPPLYNNAIDVELDDLNRIETCNYLSLEYNDKTYYYFIDDIRYVNENVVTLYISMDTIQTFMFDLIFLKYEITRKLINRWSENNINRNYLRENVSKGIFQQHSRKNYINRSDWDYAPYGGDITGLYVAKYSKKLSEWEVPGKITLDVEIPTRPQSHGFSSYYTYILPEVGHELEDKNTTINFASPVTVNFFTCINESSKSADAVEIYYIPFCNIAGLTASDGSITPISTFSFLGNRGFTAQNEHVEGENYKWNARVIYDTQYYGFIKNVSETNLFNIRYCPQLLDENYIRLIFGELDAQATYPLYMSPVDNFKCIYYGDVFSGSRYYNILDLSIFDDLNSISLNNKYNTAAIATSPNYVDMVTDSWKQWWAYNKGALLTAIGSTAMRMATAYVFAGVEAATLSEEAMLATKYSTIKMQDAIDVGDWSTRYDIALANDQYLGLNRIRQEAGYGRAAAQSIGSSQGLISFAGSAINALFQPNNPKTQGTMWANTFSSKNQIFTIWQQVNDLEECARYFETNGYKVHEIIHNALPGTNQVLPWKRTRYYYDVVSCIDMMIHHPTMIISNVLENDLRRRFSDGFRAWHCTSSLGHVYPYIENRSYYIGCTCIYDNVEV